MMAPGDHFADDLPLYALNALEGEERVTVEKHLRECSDCRSEVEQLREDWALIAAVAREPRQPQIRVRKRSVWLNALEWGAVAAAILVIVFLTRHNNHLEAQLASLQARSAADEQQLRQAKELTTALTSASAEH